MAQASQQTSAAQRGPMDEGLSTSLDELVPYPTRRLLVKGLAGLRRPPVGGFLGTACHQIWSERGFLVLYFD